MNTQLLRQAEILATEPYTTKIMADETTRGDPVFLLSHPELPGCMAQGKSIEEAGVNLEDATREYIMSLLEDGLPVPLPVIKATVTSPRLNVTNVDSYANLQGPSFLDDLTVVIQPKQRQHLGTVSLVEVG